MAALLEAVSDAKAITAALDRFLEAARSVAKRRALAPIERKLEKAMQKAFRRQGRAFVNKFKELQYWFAESVRDDEWEGLFDEAARETSDLFQKPLADAVKASLAAGAKQASADIGVQLRFDLANPRAVAYIESRGAELVRANETTKGYIRTVIHQGVTEGWSYNRMAERIIERFEEFAVGKPQKHIDSRAHGIAVTEAGNAYVEANAMVARDLQDAGLAMEKRWSTMGDGRVSEECLGNAAVGWIPFDELFPSGHAQPLAHPYCRCDLEVRRAVGETASDTAAAATTLGVSSGELAGLTAPEPEGQEPHVLGYTWFRGELPSVAAARQAGEAPDGWAMHEREFKEEYLPRFDLEDDVDRTIGLWNAPEPSFNARVKGEAVQAVHIPDAVEGR